ncbi:MAG: amino acid ABC transporter substrate-binding protein [Xanthobacteraceae bacterium]
MTRHTWLCAGGAALAALLAGAVGTPAAAEGQTLKAVKERGELVCGVSEGLPGFSAKDAKGEWSGFDVDFCRALATAIFNDPAKIRFVPLNADQRFAALQSGAIDVLSRNSTWTMAREAELKLVFPAVTYYDGQGFLVRRAMPVQSSLELDGAKVCVQDGTTSAQNVVDYFRANSMKLDLVTTSNAADAVKAYDGNLCTAFTADVSKLYAERVALAKPDEHVILPDVISKEPLGPAVRQGDEQWALIAKWTHFAMLNAEELGVSSKTIEQALKSEKSAIKRLVGTDGKLGEDIGLSPDWAVRIIRAVGNYGEAFDRNVGTGSKLAIPRGLNHLWTSGGIQYAPPLQ